MGGGKAQMRTYTPRAILRSCYLQGVIDLGGGIRAVPLDKKLGFQGELQYVFEVLSALKITSDTVFKDSATQQLAHAQPMALLELPIIEATTPYAAEEKIMRWIRVSCGTLSVLTTNMVEPIAYIMTSQSGHELKMLPPKENIIIHLPQIPGYLDAVIPIQQHALAHPELGVIVHLFRMAQRAEDIDLRVFHYVQLLEVASENESTDTLAKRIRSLLNKLGLAGEVSRIPESLGHAISPPYDFCDLLVRLRDAVAHDGHISTASVRGPFVHPFLQDIDALAKEARELVRVVIASIAGAGPTQKAKQIRV